MRALAILLPVALFVIALVIEHVVLRRRGLPPIRFHDGLTSLTLGLGVLVTGAFVKAGWLVADVLVYERFHLFSLPLSSPWVWVAGFFAVDHAYYWFHRSGHRVNFLWAAHAVHHQSEDYNLTVALRQSWVFQVFSWFFFVPLVLIGFPPVLVLTLRLVQAAYQYWLHTQVVRRLGVFEWLFTTPSHHRVHHGRNPRYIDRNHGGILIVWDRLYGTFQAEDEPVAYGTVKPLESWNAVWANVEPYLSLAKSSARARALVDRVRLWLAPPEWLPVDLGGVQQVPPVDVPVRVHGAPLHGSLRRYVTLRFVLLAIMVLAYAVAFDALAWAPRVAAAAWLFLGMGTLGGLIERRRWVPCVELSRLAVAVGLAAWLAEGVAPSALAAALACVTGLVMSTAFLRTWKTRTALVSA